jgi:peroxiredoxin
MIRRNRTWLARAAALVLVGAFLLLGWVTRARFGPVDTGTPAPPYQAVTLHGDTVALSDYAGKVVVLNVWATWCKPCIREMPALQRLHERLAERGLAVVAVNVDAEIPGLGGGAPNIADFVRDLGLTFDILRDASGTMERTFQVPALPVTYVITRDGRIHEKVLGAREWDDPRYASQIEKLLAD